MKKTITMPDGSTIEIDPEEEMICPVCWGVYTFEEMVSVCNKCLEIDFIPDLDLDHATTVQKAIDFLMVVFEDERRRGELPDEALEIVPVCRTCAELHHKGGHDHGDHPRNTFLIYDYQAMRNVFKDKTCECCDLPILDHGGLVLYPRCDCGEPTEVQIYDDSRIGPVIDVYCQKCKSPVMSILIKPDQPLKDGRTIPNVAVVIENARVKCANWWKPDLIYAEFDIVLDRGMTHGMEGEGKRIQ
jgi:hypothetical protein